MNTKLLPGLLVGFVLAVPCPLSAQPRPVLTLQQAATQALATKRSLLAARLQPQLATLQREGLQARYWPQISLAYTYQYNPILPASIVPTGQFIPGLPPDTRQAFRFGTNFSQTVGATLSQPLVEPTLKSLLGESRIQERIQQAVSDSEAQRLLYEVAHTYLTIWLDERQAATAILDTVRTQGLLRLVTERFATHRALVSDVNKARINHQNAVQQFRNKITAWLENRIYLSYLMGQTSDQVVGYDLDTTQFTPARLAWVTEEPQWDSLPELVQLSAQDALVRQQQQTLQRQYRPSIRLDGFLGANQFTNQLNPVAAGSWFGNSFIALNVRYPLLAGENRANRLRQLQLQQQSFASQQSDRRDELTKNQLVARNALAGIRAELATLQSNVTLAEQSLGVSRLRYEQGQLSALDLNTEETELQALRGLLHQKQTQLWDYWLDYLRSAGLLPRLLAR